MPADDLLITAGDDLLLRRMDIGDSDRASERCCRIRITVT